MAKKDNLIMAENIRYYLDRKGLKAIDLVNRLDIPQSPVSNWMKGNSYPRIDKINAMAEFFGCDSLDLIRDHNIQITLNEEDAIYAVIDGMDDTLNRYIVKLSELPEEKKAQVYSFIDFLSSQN